LPTDPRQILVTGATSDIGAGIAWAFAAMGDSATATGAINAEVETTAARAGAVHRRLDVRDGDAVQRLLEVLGALDVVVNCAGVIHRGAEHDPEVCAQTLDINLTGTMRVCTAACKARAGCIDNTPPRC
jgi:NAD(P)-dependent dehydrogenase (short-subunit alcohol dehydrogenase family)